MAHVDVNSYWTDSASMPSYPSLDRDLDLDVVVVGAGITGLTTAYLLKRAGLSVAVVERGRVGGVDTMRTTAHVTCVTDLRLSQLVQRFGLDHAQATWDAGLAAIDQIDTIVRDERIECEWSWVPGYLHAPPDGDSEKERQELRGEAALAEELGFDAQYLDEVPLVGGPGVMFDGQAKFHPRKYLASLARLVNGDGSAIFENTSCEEVSDNPLLVKAGGHTMACQYLVIATHTPLVGKTPIASAALLQTLLYLYSTYAIGGRVRRGTISEALFWDTANPYHHLRVDTHRDHDYAIFGGHDHKTGQVTDTASCYASLEAAAQRFLPDFEVSHRWSGQVIETGDGLPFIGETSPRQFVATGFAGNGMTFGTLAGMMARDRALGKANPWQQLFDVGRSKVKSGAWNYVKENSDYLYYLIRDRFAGPDGKSLRAVRRGQGKLLDLKGARVAVFRAEDGKVTMLSPACTHMGCNVAWNDVERTWDCPCHGSRFSATGAVISGPAEAPLAPAPS